MDRDKQTIDGIDEFFVRLQEFIQGKNYLGGTPSAEGTTQFQSQNPKTLDKSQFYFTEATSEEIGRAVSLASDAFHEVKTYSSEKIAQFLHAVADEIMSLGDILLEVGDWETGLGLVRLTGERGRTCNQLRAFATYIENGDHLHAIIDTADPDRQPTLKPDIRQIEIPLGPVGVFGASNFPFAFGVVGGDTASAWAAGCPVIAKGHPSHPMTSELFAIAINRAITTSHFPPGFFSLVQGVSNTIGQYLVSHPDLEAVAFTGSYYGGRALFDLAARRSRPIPVFAEMGSINPIFVFSPIFHAESQFIRELAETFAGSITLGVGQFCTKPGVFFLPASEKGTHFLNQIIDAITRIQPGVLLNQNIYSGICKLMAPLQESPLVDVLTGGNPENKANSFQNTIIECSADAFLNDPTLHQERFGPVALFVRYQDLDELYTLAKSLQGQLTTTFITPPEYLKKIATLSFDQIDSDLQTFHAILQKFLDLMREKAGRVIFNGVPTGVEVTPAMMHGGPYPATTSHTTSVGMTAIGRFLRPVCFQNTPDALLPDALKNKNPLKLIRYINGKFTENEIL